MGLFSVCPAAVGLLVLSTLVQAGTYSGYTTSVQIPFLEASEPGLGFGSNVHVQLRFSSPSSASVIKPFVDTGSCGIILSAADLNDWDPSEGTDTNKGWQYLSSSNLLYSGFWVERDIYFEGSSGESSNSSPLIKSTVPILAVTKKLKCLSYDVSDPGEDCPGTSSDIQLLPKGIRIMGIGFGREADGQPQGTPDKNPLLHITNISAQNMSSYWPGYIISAEGITLGLTDTNTESMNFTSLVPGGGTTPHWDLNFDWPELPACIKITAPGTDAGGPEPCLPGTAVLDTGVGSGFIRVPSGSTNLPRDPDTFNLDEGTVVQVTFGSPGVAGEEFTVGTPTESGSVTPDDVRAVYSPDGQRATAINTSRYIYRKFTVAFDPVLGLLGFGLIGG